MARGETVSVGDYALRYDDYVRAQAVDGRMMSITDVTVLRDGGEIARIRPRIDDYPQMPMTIAGAHSTLENDFYVLLIRGDQGARDFPDLYQSAGKPGLVGWHPADYRYGDRGLSESAAGAAGKEAGSSVMGFSTARPCESTPPRAPPPLGRKGWLCLKSACRRRPAIQCGNVVWPTPPPAPPHSNGEGSLVDFRCWVWWGRNCFEIES